MAPRVCKNGHLMTPENTRVTPKAVICRICQRAWQQARYEREYRALDPQARRVTRVGG